MFPSHATPVVSNHWTGLMDWIAGLDCWTGLMDWIIGLKFVHIT